MALFSRTVGLNWLHSCHILGPFRSLYPFCLGDSSHLSFPDFNGVGFKFNNDVCGTGEGIQGLTTRPKYTLYHWAISPAFFILLNLRWHLVNFLKKPWTWDPLAQSPKKLGVVPLPQLLCSWNSRPTPSDMIAFNNAIGGLVYAETWKSGSSSVKLWSYHLNSSVFPSSLCSFVSYHSYREESLQTASFLL